MSEPDPMAAALRDLQRKGGSMATFTAALVVLMVTMLREQQQRTATQAADEQRAADIRALVLQHLPEPMAQALVRSEQFPQLMDALKELQDRGGDVASFLSWAGPVLTREQASTAAASRAAAAASTSSTPVRSSTSAPQPQAPAVPDRAGLADRFRDAWAAFTTRTSTATVRSAGARAEAAELHPDQETWAVVTAVYACGVQGAIQLVQSPVWPALSQDMLARGYAHQRGETDRDAARVLEGAWREMPASRGLDWPSAAAAAFTLTRQADQLRDTDAHARAQAARSGPQHPAPAPAAAATAAAGRSAAASTGTAPATPPMGLPLTPTFSHPEGSTPPAPSTPTTPAAAAAARSSTVSAGAAVKVSEPIPPAAAQPPATGPRRSR